MRAGRSPVAGAAFVPARASGLKCSDLTFQCSPIRMPVGPTPESRSHPAAPASGVLIGIVCAVGAFAIFALHDAAIKWVVMAGYSPWQVLFARSVVILAI